MMVLILSLVKACLMHSMCCWFANPAKGANVFSGIPFLLVRALLASELKTSLAIPLIPMSKVKSKVSSDGKWQHSKSANLWPEVCLWKYVETLERCCNAPTFATTRCHQWQCRHLCRLSHNQLWCQWQYAVGEGVARQRHRCAAVPHQRPWNVKNIWETLRNHMKSVRDRNVDATEETDTLRSMKRWKLCIQFCHILPLCILNHPYAKSSCLTIRLCCQFGELSQSLKSSSHHYEILR